MEDYPHCSICLDIYGTNKSHIKAPKFLPCEDTFCKECIKEMINHSEEDYFFCPICKEKINKEQNVDKYPTNKAVMNMVDSYFNIPEIDVKNNEGERIIKYDIVLLGNSGVGKTSIFKRLLSDKYTDCSTSTIGIDIKAYYIKYKNKKYKLLFHDTAGQEKYSSITKSILREKDGVLFIYDITDHESFDKLQYWYGLYNEHNKNVTGLLIGNKCDCEHKVNEKEAEQFAKEHGLKYIETSAKLDKNIKKAIAILLEKLIEIDKINETKDNSDLGNSYKSVSSYNEPSIKITQEKTKKIKKCGC